MSQRANTPDLSADAAPASAPLIDQALADAIAAADAVEVVEDVPEEAISPDVWAARRRRRYRAAFAALSLVIAVGLWWAWDRWLVEPYIQRQAQAHRDCMGEVSGAAQSDPERCAEPTRGLYWWLVSNLSTHGEAARKGQLESEYGVREYTLRLAFADLDPHAARAAAADLLAVSLESAADDNMRLYTPELILSAGVFDPLLQRASGLSNLSRERVFNRALASADLDAALSLAGLDFSYDIAPDIEYLSSKYGIRTGALLCLHGQTDAGLQRLQRVDERVSEGRLKDIIHFASLACDSLPASGPPFRRVALTPSARRTHRFEIFTRLTDTHSKPLSLAKERIYSVPLVISVLTDELRNLPPDAPLADQRFFIAPPINSRLKRVTPDYELAPRGCALPGDILQGGRRLLLPASDYSDAAKILAHLYPETLAERDALSAPAPDESKSDQRMREDKADTINNDIEPLISATASLNHYSLVDAALDGDRDRALTHADALRPRLHANSYACVIAPLLVVDATAQAIDALKYVDMLTDPRPPSYQYEQVDEAISDLNFATLAAWALAESGQLEEAYARIDGVYRKLAPHVKHTKTSFDEGPLASAMVAAAWMRAALALRTGREPDQLGLEQPNKLRSADNGAKILSWFLHYRSSTAEERRLMRVDLNGFFYSVPTSVLPAVVYVIEAAAAADIGGNPEKRALWLAGFSKLEEFPRRYWWAREVAARWRGDEVEAKAWRARVERWRTLIRQSYQSDLLFQLSAEDPSDWYLSSPMNLYRDSR